MRGTRSSDATVQARRERILEQVLRDGEVPIEVLAERYGVSTMTVHRDLDALVAAGYVGKRRGRAVAPSTLTVQTSAVFRRRAARALKEAVARGALPFVAGARTVLVDDSTTVLPLLRMIGETATDPVTVVTNYLEVVREVERYERVRAHLLGGDYVPHLDATFGPATVDAIRRTPVEVAALSVPAVSSGTCFHTLDASVAVKLAALDTAERSVLLLDHTKTSRTGPLRVCGVERFDAVVVDEAAAPAETAAISAAGAELVLVPTPDLSEGSP